MNSTYTNIIQIRAGGASERCHAVRSVGSYNNAMHQWGVAMLAYYLFPEKFSRIVLICLTHDSAEFIWGDIPAPTLRYLPRVREQIESMEHATIHEYGLPSEDRLSEDDYVAFKACDRLELYLWCLEQAALGNRFAAEIRMELEHYFLEGGLPAEAANFVNWLSNERDAILPTQARVAKNTVERHG